MRVVIQENYDKMSKWAADYIAAKINGHKEERPFVLGLATGSSPIGVYNELVKKYKAGELSFKNVVTFNMDEYLGLPREHDQSYWYFMHYYLFDHVDIPAENVNILNGMCEDPEEECAQYEAKIAAIGGIDLFLGGIGQDGHIAFNEPYTSLTSRTGVRVLTTDTRFLSVSRLSRMQGKSCLSSTATTRLLLLQQLLRDLSAPRLPAVPCRCIKTPSSPAMNLPAAS